MKKPTKFLIATLIISCGAVAQQQGKPGKQYEDAIEDNSFLIEEAYNQEEGIVQHISNGTHFSLPQKDFTYSFTQEWPVFNQAHQFSFTIPYQFLNANTVRGAGDVFVNYRYQLLTGDDWAAIAENTNGSAHGLHENLRLVFY